MARHTGEAVTLKGRAYTGHYYQVNYWSGSKKIDLYVVDNNAAGTKSSITVKMTKAEAEELIVRLQYAIYEADNTQ